MFKRIRNSKISKGLAVYFSLSLIFQIVSPTVALALTSGPGQEEFASFEPASTSDMVDLYSGDYNYNIPLLSVPGPNGGYPINIAYHSGIGMEQEASWVGLGWNINVGAISRNLRGLPDDFNGDAVTKTQHTKEAITASLDLPTDRYRELVGFPTGEESSTGSSSSSSIGQKLQMYYNNYKGLGTRYSVGFNGSSPLGLDISSDSQNGLGIGLSYSAKSLFNAGGVSGGFEAGANYNSRQGLQSFNFSTTSSFGKTTVSENGNTQSYGGSSTATLSFSTVFGVPKTNIEMTSTTVPFKLRLGLGQSIFRFESQYPISGSVYTSKIENDGVDNVPATGYLNTSSGKATLKDFSRDEIIYSKKIPHLATSTFTYDLYTQTGQGTGSMFRPYLNNFGVLSDPQKISKDQVRGLGLEIGVGGSLDVHAGVDFDYGDGQNSSGPWTQTGSFSDYGTGLEKLIHWTKENNEIDYEPYYFQVIGEKTGTYLEDDQLANFKGDMPVRIALQKERDDKSFLTRHFRATDNLITTEPETATTTLDGLTQTKQKSTDKRTKRATSIETLNTAESQLYGYSKNVQYRQSGSLVSKDFSKPNNHISEISMLQPDGMRYVYGLPAYNNKQVENVFAVTADAGMTPNITEADVHEGGAQNYGGINVTGTFDEFVSKSELPSYAHSWMLTSVMSADYLDMTNNGPTDDDFGYWVKFNYKKIASNYKWRIPFSKSNYLDGYKNNPNDNKGSYSYGEKDIYVLESIETKTHIAIFETSSRQDGYEASGEYSNTPGAAARGIQTMQKLDKIKLFTKKEYAQSTPVPTKVINFEYSYDLCANVPNNSGIPVNVSGTTPTGGETNVNANSGKLTLTKLYFTYQNSSRGSLNPYVFNYGDINDSQDNPDYDKRDMDRWGNYKNHMAYANTSGYIPYPYTDRPYTEQDGEYYFGDELATSESLKPAPWTLKEISLPTGGTLKMEYESDDYAFVENKQAMRMFDICGLDKPGAGGLIETSTLSSHSIRTNNNSVDTEAGTTGGGLNRVYFKLEQTMSKLRAQLGGDISLPTPPTDKDLFYEVYLKNAGTHIYYNTYAKLRNPTAFSSDDIYDYVKGYAEIDFQDANYGVTAEFDPTPGSTAIDDKVQFGYFTLKTQKLSSPVNTTGIWASPFTVGALQHLKANRSEIVYSAMPYAGSSAMAQIMALFTALPGQLTDLMSTTMGFNNYAYARNWGKEIALNGKSIIRLCEPDYKKIGGGVRIKKITLNDNWKNDATTNANSIYGQEYDYTTTASIAGKEVVISSGVTYEPQVGGDESALRSPIPYTNSIPLHANYNLFQENPILESYYPGANVGYSKVTVKSIAPTQAESENASNELLFSSAPITISEFYTPKDFPVLFDKTDMNPGQPIRIPIMIPGLLSSFTTRQAKSQGYSIITNDMAGKPKSVTIKTRNGDQIISKQKFIYNTESEYNEDAINKLSSKVQTLEVDKTDNYEVKYKTSIVGQTHDMFIDMNEDAQEMESFGLETNLDLHYTTPAAVAFMIMPIPTVKVDKSSLRTIVFNKTINRTGILKKVETTTNESKIITENLAYDIETGEPILTKVTNEFKDPVYNFSYPGHWFYPNLEGAYKNDGLAIDPAGSTTYTSNATTGYINISASLNSRPVSDYFTKGDLVYVDCAPAANAYDGEYHIFNIAEPNSILLINSLGHLFPTSVGVESIKVIKSGFKNMQSAKVGNLVFKSINPTFKQYLPSDHAGTVATSLTDVFSSDLTDNKIINATAIEYKNDWQVFCGPEEAPAVECICYLMPSAFSFLSMLQELNENNLLFSEDVELHNMVSGTYSNGFSAGLLNTSSKLISIKTTELACSSCVKKFYYQGHIDVSGKLQTIIYHDPTDNVVESPYIKADCRVEIDLPSGTEWDDVESFAGISKAPATGGSECINPNGIYLEVIRKNGERVTATISVQSTCSTEPCEGCWEFQDCYSRITPNYACGITEGSPVNPYLAGMKGMWRPQASYAYNTLRTQANNLKEDGVYTDFVRFPWEDPALKDAKWIKATTVTKYSPYGFELENQDALGNYSSALYGYSQSLVTAIGSNAMYKEIAFDNFEDYPLDCNDRHFRFYDDMANVTSSQSHTGRYSISVNPSSSIDVQAPVANACAYAPIDNTTNPTTRISHDGKYVAHLVESCDCLGTFSPLPNKKYVASVWTKQINHSGPLLAGVTNYTAPEMKITITLSSGGPTIYTFTPKGNVIDGWQQIFESFNIPSNATGITVELINTLSDKNVYFDDIRLHPFDGNMVSYVYDPILLKTMAELDANNYATIYVYDDEGHLNKVKKETSEGIKTIKEGRINTKKIYE